MSLLSTSENVARQALKAKMASLALAALTPEQKKRVLEAVAAAIEQNAADILFHNEIDVEAAREAELSPAMVDRLVLTQKAVAAMAQGVREIAQQPDPIG